MCFILATKLEQESISISLGSKTYSQFKVISIRRIPQARSRSCIRRRDFYARFRVMGWKMSKGSILWLLGGQGYRGGTIVNIGSSRVQKTNYSCILNIAEDLLPLQNSSTPLFFMNTSGCARWLSSTGKLVSDVPHTIRTLLLTQQQAVGAGKASFDWLEARRGSILGLNFVQIHQSWCKLLFRCHQT